MKIRDVMTPNPRTVSPNDTVQHGAQVMKAEDTGAVPVVQDGRVLALVTDRDIVVRVVADGGTVAARSARSRPRAWSPCRPTCRPGKPRT